MGLQAGCLPLAVEVGRYTGVPYRQGVCRLCDGEEVEGQAHFLINCHKLNCIRQNCSPTALPEQITLLTYQTTTNTYSIYVS